MPTVKYTQPNGAVRDVNVPIGISVMQGARKSGVDGILAECGGACSCATCHVYVDSDWESRLAPMSDTENAMLEYAEDRRPNSRLSCQIVMTDQLDGLCVVIAEDQ